MAASQEHASERQLEAERLKERIYIAFATLAVLVALRGHLADAGESIATIVVTVLGLVLAVFVADMLAHFVVHRQAASTAEVRQAIRSSFGAAGVAIVPVVLLAGAALGLWSTDTALLAGQLVVVGALVVVAYLAVRRVPMRPWQRVLALAAEGAIGLLVVTVQVAAHGGGAAR